ncbi:MAG: hypothetical protein NTY66_01805 [Candidatus Vogelbacteria bacterium]|nr:hypothetical protein [Candidatus Vogelbacteria bacterium]
MNTKKFSKEELRAKYDLLPLELKEALDSDTLLDTIQEVSLKYRLHVDQRGDLAEEIGLVLLGATPLENFLGSLETRLRLPVNIAGEIVKDVNSKLFFPIRTALERINRGGVEPYRSEQQPKVESFSPAGNVSSQNIRREGEMRATPGNNALIVSNTAPLTSPDSDRNAQKPAEQQMFDEKMGKLFRLPKEQVDLGSPDPTAPQTGPDPYREKT